MHSSNYKNTKTKIRRRGTNKRGKGHKSVKNIIKVKNQIIKKIFTKLNKKFRSKFFF